MTIDPELLELMPTEVRVEFFTGTDSVGNDQFSDEVTRRARVEANTRTTQVTTVPGETMLADAGLSTTVYLDYQEPIVPTKSRITLPSSRELIVVTEVVEYDENGPYYQMLQCSNNQEG
jgi:hypothetical protein